MHFYTYLAQKTEAPRAFDSKSTHFLEPFTETDVSLEVNGHKNSCRPIFQITGSGNMFFSTRKTEESDFFITPINFSAQSSRTTKKIEMSIKIISSFESLIQ
jgi:hypothetical protein